LREAGVERYLTHLAVDRDLSASSQNQAVCALVFLYRDVLKEPLGEFSAVRAKRPQRLPTVLSVDEVRRVLTALGRHPTFGLMGQLLYGGGLRVGECCELRVMDLDFDRRQVWVRDGKGGKDRAVPLPAVALGPLRGHLESVKRTHDRDAAKGPDWGWAPVPAGVEHKCPGAGREWGRKFAFPSAVVRWSELRRRHERWHTSPTTIAGVQSPLDRL
jgi:integrase